MRFLVEKSLGEKGKGARFTITPNRRKSRNGGTSTKPLTYTLVKRGQGISEVDKGYKALVRDYPKSYKQAIAQCLEIIRGEQREKMEAERRSVSIEVVESLQPPRTFFVEGMTVLWFKKRGLAARFVVLVPSGKHQIFSTVFTFLVSKGKVKETRETLAFVRKFPANGLAVINWMEEAVNGKK